MKRGLEAGGQTVKLPAPRLNDGQDAKTQRTVLKEIAGSDGKVEEMLRDSVTAPFIMKVRDTKVVGASIRQADLWFAVHGDLEKIDPDQVAMRTDQTAVEVANMSFQARFLKSDEIRAAGGHLPETGIKRNEWYSHIHSTLLDRIDFEVTNHTVVSRSSQSIVIASATDPSFGQSGSLANAWKPLTNGSVSQGKNSESASIRRGDQLRQDQQRDLSADAPSS